MQALRNSVYLIVAAGSVALAACQPPDRITEASAEGLQQIALQFSTAPVDGSAAVAAGVNRVGPVAHSAR